MFMLLMVVVFIVAIVIGMTVDGDPPHRRFNLDDYRL